MQPRHIETRSLVTDTGDDTSVSDRLLARRQAHFGYFCRRLGHLEDAEDAFQDFCLKAIRHAGQLDDKSRIDTWLCRLRERTLIDHYRRRAARRRGHDAFEREAQSSPVAVDPPAFEGACSCVRQKLSALRTEYADVIRRADLEEQPRRQIATELNISTNNVGVRLHRARQALKKTLRDHCPTCGVGNYRQCGCGAERLEAA